MVTPNTLADIRKKVRNLTARQADEQITDAQIDQYINTYYLYDMPESLRLLKLKWDVLRMRASGLPWAVLIRPSRML